MTNGSFVRSLVVGALFVGVGAAGAGLALPALGGVDGLRQVAESAWRSVSGTWTQTACTADAVGCLAYQETRLTAILERQEQAIKALRPAAEAIAAAIGREEKRLAQNDLLLREGRALLQASVADGPVRFVGEQYPDKAALTRQLRTLFAEGQQIERIRESMRQQANAIRTRHDELLVSRGEVRAALATLPARIELARAGAVLDDISGAIQTLTTTAAAAEQRVGSLDALIRTTDELARDASRPATASPEGREAPSLDDSAFQRFLQQR